MLDHFTGQGAEGIDSYCGRGTNSLEVVSQCIGSALWQQIIRKGAGDIFLWRSQHLELVQVLKIKAYPDFSGTCILSVLLISHKLRIIPRLIRSMNVPISQSTQTRRFSERSV